MYRRWKPQYKQSLETKTKVCFLDTLFAYWLCVTDKGWWKIFFINYQIFPYLFSVTYNPCAKKGFEKTFFLLRLTDSKILQVLFCWHTATQIMLIDVRYVYEEHNTLALFLNSFLSLPFSFRSVTSLVTRNWCTGSCIHFDSVHLVLD